MRLSRRTAALVAMTVIANLLTSSCTPAEVDQTITDIGDVVSIAGTVVTVVQSTGLLVPRADQVTSLEFAAKASLASWRAANEANSKDSLYKKNERIDSLFKEIPRPNFDSIQDETEKAAAESLASAIDVLRGRLEGNRAQMRARPAVGDKVVTVLPKTLDARLNKIKTQASQTMASAEALIKQGQQ